MKVLAEHVSAARAHLDEVSKERVDSLPGAVLNIAKVALAEVRMASAATRDFALSHVVHVELVPQQVSVQTAEAA